MLRVFIGYDHRQPVSVTALTTSIVAQASQPVAITPLVLPALPIKRQGLTPFTYSRFLVPHLCNYEGVGLFLDADMILNADIAGLFALMDDSAVMVAKNKHRFEWASVMLFNCAHPDNRKLTPEYIETADKLHGISWTDSIGDLPPEWNHLVGYDEPKEAKLVHYTQGVPAWPETAACEQADLWRKWATVAITARPWAELMGESVHSVEIPGGKKLPKFLFDLDKQCVRPEYESVVRGLA